MENFVEIHYMPQKAPKINAGDAPGVIQARPHAKIGGGPGPLKQADQPPSEQASDNENGDRDEGEGDANGNGGNAGGNGGNGGDGGSDSSDSSMCDDG